MSFLTLMHMQECGSEYVHLNVHVCVRCIYICMCMCLYIYIYVCVCLCVCLQETVYIFK